MVARSPFPLAQRVGLGDRVSTGSASEIGRVAAGSEIVMVRPPPGVSSGLRVPDMASISPRDKARPRPTPLVLSRSPSRWNGWKIWSQSASGMPGPQSMTRISTAVPSGAGSDLRRGVGGLWRMAFCTRLAIARSSRAGSAEHLACPPGRGWWPRRRPAPSCDGGGDDIGDVDRLDCERESTSLQPAHVEQVLDQTAQPVQRLFMRGEQLGPIVLAEREVRHSKGSDRCLGRGQRSAQVVAHRIEQRGP